LPAYALDNPDLYLLCKDYGEYRTIGLWNCAADEVMDAVLPLDTDVAEMECFRCNAKVVGKGKIQVEHIAAYSFAFIRVKLK